MPPTALPSERLQKLIAATGLCSRRRAEDLLRAGRVRVNGRPASLGDRADPARDRILVDGRPLRPANAPLTLLLHKPMGVLSSCGDPQGRPTVLDLLPEELRHGVGLHPVGRLDGDSRGALLLSNDGRLTLRLTHPRYGHAKTYRVRVAGQPTAEVLEAWRRGLPLDGVPSQPVRLRQLRQGPQDTWLELVMREGRNRQIRRTAALLGHPVRDLQRTAIGPLGLGDLPEGGWRPLRPGELKALLRPEPLDGDPASPEPRNLHPITSERPTPERRDPDRPIRERPRPDRRQADLPHQELRQLDLANPDRLRPDPLDQEGWPENSRRPAPPQPGPPQPVSRRPPSRRPPSQRAGSAPPISPPANSPPPNSRRLNAPRLDSARPDPSRPASWQNNPVLSGSAWPGSPQPNSLGPNTQRASSPQISSLPPLDRERSSSPRDSTRRARAGRASAGQASSPRDRSRRVTSEQATSEQARSARPKSRDASR